MDTNERIALLTRQIGQLSDEFEAQTQQMKQMQTKRKVSEWLLVIMIQFVGISLGSMNGVLSPITPTLGVAVALLFMRGQSIKWALCIGQALGYLFIGFSTLSTLGLSLLGPFAAISIVRFTKRFVKSGVIFTNPTSILKFSGISLLVSTLVQLPTTHLLLSQSQIWPSFTTAWAFFSLRDSLSVLGFGSFFLIWQHAIIQKPSYKQLLSWFPVYLLLTALMLGSAFSTHLMEYSFFALVTFPTALLTAICFKPRGASLSLLIIHTLTLWQSMNPFGIFAQSLPTSGYLVLQGKLLFEAFFVLLLAALIQDIVLERRGLKLNP